MNTIYLTDIVGTIGEWLDAEFDNEVPNEVVGLLHKVYKIATKEDKTEQKEVKAHVRPLTPYERCRSAVYATGNRWAIENFNATH